MDNLGQPPWTTSRIGTTSVKARWTTGQPYFEVVPEVVQLESLVNTGKNSNLGQLDNFSL
nr:MAG TPA: hypothetical protein [Caudoviricetes sp.]